MVELQFEYQLNPFMTAMERRYCFDIEANGLLKEVSLFFCAVVQDIDTDEIWYYAPDNLEAFLKKLDEAQWLIGHNIIGYDLPALHKLHGWAPKNNPVIYDTVIAARLYNPNLEMHPDCPKKVFNAHTGEMKNVGPHTLMNLGFHVGCHKGDFGEDHAFDEYCPEMMTYCAQDVNVNVKVFQWLEKRLRAWSNISIQSEMDTASAIAAQMRAGWYFNIEKADSMRSSLEELKVDLENQVRCLFTPILKPKAMEAINTKEKAAKVIQPRVNKNGVISSVGLKGTYGEGYAGHFLPIQHRRYPDRVEYHSGAFCPLKEEVFNLGSRGQIADRLVRAGVTWTKFTKKGNPIVDDDVLDGVAHKYNIPEVQLIQRYFKVSKILSMVTSWIEAYDWDTGCIHGFVNSVGAVTNRMTHSSPNVAQTPSAKTDKEGNLIWGEAGGWGADCRDLFTVPEDYVLVGCDASGLELRCLAHYMNDPEYTDLILHGDIHTHNQNAAGLPTRNNAKTFIYAFLYGAGDEKIGSIVLEHASSAEKKKKGKALKAKFLNGLPKLKRLLERVGDKVEATGATGVSSVKGLDGRRIRVRSAHAALNSLLQSCGAIVMKYWAVCVINEATRRGLDFQMVGNIHDEGQFQVHKNDVAEFKEICEAAFPAVERHLKFRCPLAGEAMEGTSWAHTH